MRLRPKSMSSGRIAVAGAEQGGTEDQVLQLADVSRPIVAHQFGPRLRRYRARTCTHLFDGLIKKIIDQFVYIFAPLTQRWQADRDNTEAEVEIFPELTRRDRRLKILIGGGDNSRLHL